MPPVNKKPQSSSVSDQHKVKSAIGWRFQVNSNVWSPPTDMYETDDKYVVRVEIAGADEEDFTVNVEDHILVISGVRSEIPERRAYHQMEIRFGKFLTAVGLPGLVDYEKSRAEYENGILTVTLPKVQPSRIEIKDTE